MRKNLVLLFAGALVLLFAVPAQAGTNRNFVAPLNGGEEVPAVDTDATGVAKFKVSRDGTSIEFRVNVANIDNVFASHIHCAPAGVNGPVGVTLFFTPPPALGSTNGTLATGVVTAPNDGNSCGWASIDDVVEALASGDTYVNVHTNPGTPSGEVRGQVR